MSARPLEGFRVLDLTRVLAGAFAAPGLGADNAAVYGELGLDAAALERLAREGVV